MEEIAQLSQLTLAYVTCVLQTMYNVDVSKTLPAPNAQRVEAGSSGPVPVYCEPILIEQF